MLAARDARWRARTELARRHPGGVTVAMTVCLPLSFRTAPAVDAVFAGMAAAVREWLVRTGAEVIDVGSLAGDDGRAALWVVSGRAREVKLACVAAEERLPAGRMLDIDVMDDTGAGVGRDGLGLPPRGCFVCGDGAAGCVSRRRHPPAELRPAITRLIARARTSYPNPQAAFAAETGGLTFPGGSS